jgi:hypothetical protein
LLEIFWNIEQVPYPRARGQSCRRMSLDIDQAQQPFYFSLGTFVMNLAMIHFIMNDAQELLSLNRFCFPTRRKLFIWLLVIFMPCEFQFVFLVVNIVFSNFGIHFFQGLLNYAFEKGWTFFLDIHIAIRIEMTFLVQSTHNILRDWINILVPC